MAPFKKETETPKGTILRFFVEAEDAGQRLDSFLSNHAENLSRVRIQALLGQGHISSKAGLKLSASLKTKEGQEFEIFVPHPIPADPRPQHIQLDIRYEDQDLIVIEKPVGMVIHPAPGNEDQTLVNALLHHCGESLSGIGGVKRPGIVHRLDKDTSGLVVIAKNDYAHQDLTRQFAERTIHRGYYALLWGMLHPCSGAIEGDIGRHPQNRKKMAIVDKNGRYALTYYKTLELFEAWASLVECKLATGRTHQIRVHMASKGHPIIGDPVYGGTKFPKNFPQGELKEELVKHKGQLLHAFKLGFTHPTSKNDLYFESETPIFFKNIISLFKKL